MDDYDYGCPPLHTVFPDRFPGIIAREALLAGQAVPDLSAPFVYCDLVSECAETLLVLAASYPESSFFGVGLPPHEAGPARARAEALDLHNVTFHEDFNAIPPSDFVCCSGTWEVDDENLVEAVRLLKIGGLLQVSAVLEAGQGPLNLLRMLHSTAQDHGDSKREGELERVAQLVRAEAPLRRDNPLLSNIVDDWENRELAEVVLETSQYASPITIRDLLDAASKLGLTCCGPLESLSPMGQSIAHHFAPDLKGDSGPEISPVLEDYYSILKGETSRSIVFVKSSDGAVTRGPMSILGAHVIGFHEPILWSEAVDAPPAPLGEWTAAQDHEPLSLGTVMAQVATEAVRGDDIESVGKMIGQALNERKALLYASDTVDVAISPDSPIEAAHALTTEILDTPRAYRFGGHVPSPVFGGGVFLTPTRAALLRATLEGESDRATRAKTLITEMDSRAPPYALEIPDRALPDPTEELSDFDAKWLPFLARIGVIQARPS